MVEALQPPLDHLLEVTPELDREDEAFEQQQRALAKPKALNKGGGMYSWERGLEGRGVLLGVAAPRFNEEVKGSSSDPREADTSPPIRHAYRGGSGMVERAKAAAQQALGSFGQLPKLPKF
eukprot:1194727-Prorocentrum_minimum.AAC.5